MRVNQPQMRGNSQYVQGQRPASQNTQRISNGYRDTEVMQLARKIKAEQGSRTAGYFLFAMKPFVAPNEIMFIERELNVRCERDPKYFQQHNVNGRQQNNGFNPQFMQMMMNMIRSGGKIDPMTFIKMMNKKN